MNPTESWYISLTLLSGKPPCALVMRTPTISSSDGQAARLTNDKRKNKNFLITTTGRLGCLMPQIYE